VISNGRANLLAFLPTGTRFRKTETSFDIHIPQFIEQIRIRMKRMAK